jgi:hypothetical protein
METPIQLSPCETCPLAEKVTDTAQDLYLSVAFLSLLNDRILNGTITALGNLKEASQANIDTSPGYAASLDQQAEEVLERTPLLSRVIDEATTTVIEVLGQATEIECTPKSAECCRLEKISSVSDRLQEILKQAK